MKGGRDGVDNMSEACVEVAGGCVVCQAFQPKVACERVEDKQSNRTPGDGSSPDTTTTPAATHVGTQSQMWTPRLSW